MKPAAFEYYKASDLEETLQFIAEHGEDCKIIAGGQSLVPLLNMRIAQPGCLIDVNDLSDLDYIREDSEWIKIGALTRQRSLETSEIVKRKFPVLVEAVKNIGHPQTRNRGTIGGSLAHAEPSAEIALILLSLDAEVVISHVDGKRTVTIDEFLIAEFTTLLEENEMLTEVRFKSDTTRSGFAFEEFAIRLGDFAIAASVCLMNVDAEGRMRDVRIAMSGLDARPIILEKAEKALEGSELSEDVIGRASEVIVEVADVEDDMHSSRDYKINIAKVLLENTIRKAFSRAVELGDAL